MSSRDRVSGVVFLLTASVNVANGAVFLLCFLKAQAQIELSPPFEFLTEDMANLSVLGLAVTWIVAVIAGVTHLLCGASRLRCVLVWLILSVVANVLFLSGPLGVLFP